MRTEMVGDESIFRDRAEGGIALYWGLKEFGHFQNEIFCKKRDDTKKITSVRIAEKIISEPNCKTNGNQPNN